MIADIHDEEKCQRCGGSCCKIYANPEFGGTFPSDQIWFETQVHEFHQPFWKNPHYYGIEPRFDPYLAHLAHLDTEEAEAYRKELEEKGIDIYFCQFHDPSIGCTIPWEKRP